MYFMMIYIAHVFEHHNHECIVLTVLSQCYSISTGLKIIFLFTFTLKVYGSMSQNKDGTTGFTLLIMSEDNSLVLVEQLNAASPGMICGQPSQNLRVVSSEGLSLLLSTHVFHEVVVHEQHDMQDYWSYVKVL